MKEVQHFNKITLFIGLIALLLLNSCITYKNGFIRIPERVISSKVATINLDSILNKKQEVTRQSEALIAKIEETQREAKPIAPNYLILLFENLNAHYQLDSAIHTQYKQAETEESKFFWQSQILKSASDYNRLFEHNVEVRRIINLGDKGFGVSKNVLRRSQEYLLQNFETDSSIEKRTVAKQIHKERRTDKWFNLFHKSIGYGSQLVGITISNIYLAPHPKKNIPHLMPYLQPYDIILQKSRNRLTDKFIPGYFGHAAIYMGDSLFAEALHEGVVLSDPFKFAEGDSYLIIRVRNLNNQQKERIAKLINAQLGKSYDYQYDAQSTDEITCSELIYLSYDFIPWNTQKVVGRYTFSPDDIPGTTLTSEQLEFVIYFDKKRSIEKPSNMFIKELLD